MGVPQMLEGPGRHHSYSQSSLKNRGVQEGCLRTGRKQTSLWSSKWAKRRIQGTTSQSVSPQSLERWGNGSSLWASCERQEGDKEQWAWIHQKEVMFNRTGYLLWWDRLLNGWGESGGCCLPELKPGSRYHHIIKGKVRNTILMIGWGWRTGWMPGHRR